MIQSKKSNKAIETGKTKNKNANEWVLHSKKKKSLMKKMLQIIIHQQFIT